MNEHQRLRRLTDPYVRLDSLRRDIDHRHAVGVLLPNVHRRIVGARPHSVRHVADRNRRDKPGMAAVPPIDLDQVLAAHGDVGEPLCRRRDEVYVIGNRARIDGAEHDEPARIDDHGLPDVLERNPHFLAVGTDGQVGREPARHGDPLPHRVRGYVDDIELRHARRAHE